MSCDFCQTMEKKGKRIESQENTKYMSFGGRHLRKKSKEYLLERSIKTAEPKTQLEIFPSVTFKLDFCFKMSLWCLFPFSFIKSADRTFLKVFYLRSAQMLGRNLTL